MVMFVLKRLFNNRKDPYIRVGLLFAMGHFCFIGLILCVLPFSGQSGIGLLLLLVSIDFFVAPLLLVLAPIAENSGVLFMLILVVVNALLGTVGWFFIPIGVMKIVKRASFKK